MMIVSSVWHLGPSNTSALDTVRACRLAQNSGANGVIVCGDFNMTPDSALYHYMVKGKLQVDGLDR